jgi:hypothetical protein
MPHWLCSRWCIRTKAGFRGTLQGQRVRRGLCGPAGRAPYYTLRRSVYEEATLAPAYK